MKGLLFTIIAIAALNAEMASGTPLEDGAAAYGRGDYTNALRIFRPLAAQGNSLAQFNLGLMYNEGQGGST